MGNIAHFSNNGKSRPFESTFGYLPISFSFLAK